MSTELVPYVLPATGEVINLEEPLAVARALHEVRAAKRQLDDARRVLEDALVQHSQTRGTKTLRIDEYEATVSGGEKVEWDVEELWKLRDAGLPEDRMNALVKTEVTYKVDAAVARQIAAANPDYGEIIYRAKQKVPAPWRVSVKGGRS